MSRTIAIVSALIITVLLIGGLAALYQYSRSSGVAEYKNREAASMLHDMLEAHQSDRVDRTTGLVIWNESRVFFDGTWIGGWETVSGQITWIGVQPLRLTIERRVCDNPDFTPKYRDQVISAIHDFINTEIDAAKSACDSNGT